MAFKLAPSADAPVKPSCRGTRRLQVRRSGVDPRVVFSISFPRITADLGATLQSHCHRERKTDPAKTLPSAEISRLACLTALPGGVSVLL